MLLLTRLYFNEGKATSDDCIMLMEAYKDLYGERMPYFEKINLSVGKTDRILEQKKRI